MEREEAIRRIKAWNLDPDDMEVLATAIPELKENEDERIRMALIKLMTVAGENYVRSATGFEKEQLIAYIEKQQERNVVPSRETILGICWKEDPEEREGLTQLQYIQKYWNKKCDYQKEQKPINNSTREKIISRATSEKQVVLLSESNGNAEIGWDTRSLEDAKKLLEYGIAFINEQLGTKPAECGDDEKIRKGLIQHLKELRNWKAGTMSPIKVPAHYDAWITYLEKQKEQKPELYYDKELGNAAREFYLSGGADSPVDSTGLVPIVRMAEFGATWMKERIEKEQKPVNHNLTTFHRDVVYAAMCNKNLDEGLRCNLEMVYKTIKELVDRAPVIREQKPRATINGEPIPTENQSVDIPLVEWSNEDEILRVRTINRLETLNFHGISGKEIRESIDWLESLPERFNLQTK